MCEHNSEGTCVSAAIERIAAYAKLSRDQADRLIHGYDDKRSGERRKGFLERGVLTVLAPRGKRGRKRVAIYRINEAALHLDSRVTSYREADAARAAQRQIPGIIPPPKAQPQFPQPAVSDATPDFHTSARCGRKTIESPHGADSLLRTVRTDSRSLIDSNTLIQGQERGATNAPPPCESLALQAQKPRYTQADFDARDWRKLNQELNLLREASVGSGGADDWRSRFALACQRAGISVRRGEDLFRTMGE